MTPYKTDCTLLVLKGLGTMGYYIHLQVGVNRFFKRIEGGQSGGQRIYPAHGIRNRGRDAPSTITISPAGSLPLIVALRRGGLAVYRWLK